MLTTVSMAVVETVIRRVVGVVGVIFFKTGVVVTRSCSPGRDERTRGCLRPPLSRDGFSILR